MAIEMVVGNMKFPSKIKAIEFFREILNRYKVGEEIVGDDAEVVNTLLHSRADKIAELGHRKVVRYIVGRDPIPYRRSFCFMAELDDGSFLDISFKNFIDKFTPSST